MIVEMEAASFIGSVLKGRISLNRVFLALENENTYIQASIRLLALALRQPNHYLRYSYAFM